MPLLREDLRLSAEVKVEAEAAKEQREVGLGCAIANVRDRAGAIVAYRITVNTNIDGGRVGTSIAYPDIPAIREPTDEEVDAIVREYGDNLVAEIKRRRSDRKQLEAVEATKVR